MSFFPAPKLSCAKSPGCKTGIPLHTAAIGTAEFGSENKSVVPEDAVPPEGWVHHVSIMFEHYEIRKINTGVLMSD
ncbi:hypothetical protein CEXT_339631 [Caerostris extrusa]|uniref:Uncharacterized protein n=1 Tax=Caerostris extrusa TaxID=172846 RepID=A0AAV4XLW5_CAEEX|nr:hypothetical protein CEXT_339631 [Caerostris extrusa]